MRTIVWILIALLLIAHQDNFLWHDDALVWGFLPIGLAYHAGISVAAGVVWLLAIKFCWPAEVVGEVRSGGRRP